MRLSAAGGSRAVSGKPVDRSAAARMVKRFTAAASYGSPLLLALATGEVNRASRVRRSAPMIRSSCANSDSRPSAGASSRASSRIRFRCNSPSWSHCLSNHCSTSARLSVRDGPLTLRDEVRLSRSARAVEAAYKARSGKSPGCGPAPCIALICRPGSATERRAFC